MADDDDNPSSTPWGRSRRSPGQPTPRPAASPPGTPPPSTEPATWSAPAPGAPAPATPAPGAPGSAGAPQPFSLDKAADSPPTEGIPGQAGWNVPPSAPPDGAPPGSAGYPPPGYPPPGGPVPASKGGGGGVVIAIVAVVIVLLLVVGGAVALIVVGRDDGEAARDGSSVSPASATTEAPSDTSAGPATEPATEVPATEVPATDGEPGTTEPFVPPTAPGSDSLSLPEGFPRPDGATDGFLGLEVEGQTAEQVRDFYLDALPAGGYTVGEIIGAGGSYIIPVTGNGVDGQLLVTATPGLPTSIVWVAT